MSEEQNINVSKEVAPWLRTAAFNNYWTYSFIGRATFYSMISPEYYDFMNRFVKNWLWWYDGYVPYFHNADQGIPSTRIGAALVNKIARKVIGGRLMFKNAGKDKTNDKLNKALKFISSDWGVNSNFESVATKAINYAAQAGTSLLKLNKSNGQLWAEALRLDSFIPVIGNNDEVIEVKCFLHCFSDFGVTNEEGKAYDSYYLVEYRHYTDYTGFDGKTIQNAPVSEFVIHKQRGSITNGNYVTQSPSGRVPFKQLPTAVKRTISKAYPTVRFDSPTLLPFTNLGCEIVKWSEGISGLPEVPLGESFLAPLISYLMEWDFYHACANTDMYLGRGRVLLSKFMNSATGGNYNSGLDDFIYNQYNSQNPENQKPVPIQFELRSGDWTAIRDRLIQDIAINSGLNPSTIASFLADNTARTAREVSTEENETAEYVNSERAIIERPINRLLKTVTTFYGYEDTVVLRWSSAGLTNRLTLTEILGNAIRDGYCSKWKAVQMFNIDDDPEQVEEEYNRCKEESESNNMPWNEKDYFGGLGYDEKAEDSAPRLESASADDNGRGDGDTANGQERVLAKDTEILNR